MSINKDMPAYPQPKQILGSGEDYHEIPGAPGISIIQWFAGMALNGLSQNNSFTANFSYETIGEMAARLAKATFEALNKTSNSPEP